MPAAHGSMASLAPQLGGRGGKRGGGGGSAATFSARQTVRRNPVKAALSGLAEICQVVGAPARHEAIVTFCSLWTESRLALWHCICSRVSVFSCAAGKYKSVSIIGSSCSEWESVQQLFRFFPAEHARNGFFERHQLVSTQSVSESFLLFATGCCAWGGPGSNAFATQSMSLRACAGWRWRTLSAPETHSLQGG